MSEQLGAGRERLVAALIADLRPVTRLAPPWQRAAMWLCGAVWIGLLLAVFAHFAAMWHRLIATPDLGLAVLGAAATGIAASLAAFMTSVPGRSPWWAVLPAPFLLVWVGASGFGCLRQVPTAFTEPEATMHPMVCFYFIVLVSAPLSAVLLWQIMRACPLRPVLTACMVGLASAGAAATLLTMIHPFDANALDLITHLVAVLVVVAAVRSRAALLARAGAGLPASLARAAVLR